MIQREMLGSCLDMNEGGPVRRNGVLLSERLGWVSFKCAPVGLHPEEMGSRIFRRLHTDGHGSKQLCSLTCRAEAPGRLVFLAKSLVNPVCRLGHA